MKIRFFIILLLSETCYSQVSSERLFNSFYQGERNNCASVALIKASLYVYGLNNLFKTDQIDGNSYRVVLKNNATITITSIQLLKADSSAGFRLLDSLNTEVQEIKKYAVFSYCVMAEYKRIIDHHSSFDIALDSLENGAWSPTIYKYLGFEIDKNVIPLRRLTGKNNCGLVAWSPHHAVFVCDGYMDYHGTKKKVWAKYSGRFQVVKIENP